MDPRKPVCKFEDAVRHQIFAQSEVRALPPDESLSPVTSTISVIEPRPSTARLYLSRELRNISSETTNGLLFQGLCSNFCWTHVGDLLVATSLGRGVFSRIPPTVVAAACSCAETKRNQTLFFEMAHGATRENAQARSTGCCRDKQGTVGL